MIPLKHFINFYRARRRGLKTAAIVLSAGIIYYIITQTTSFGIPCAFYKITGLACPGCGISRMIIALLHLDFTGAAKNNAAIAVLAPIWLILTAIRIIFKPACLRKNSKLFDIFVWFSIIFLLVFGVVRNLPGMEFLLP